MGNTQSNNEIVDIKKPLYQNVSYSTIKPNEITNLRNDYKIIDIKWLDLVQINLAMFGDEYFEKHPNKKQIVYDMTEHFSTDPDKSIYKKKTNYLCNQKEKLCICNVNANDFRKIYDGCNYTDECYVAWIKKANEPF